MMHSPLAATRVDPTSDKIKIIFGLQYLRAIAAFMVIYFHAVLQIRIFSGDGSIFPLLGSGGVDIFFVLSGFMMWYSAAKSPTTPSKFFLRRIIRVAPLYWVMTVLALAVAIALPALLRSTLFDPPHAIASLFFLPWQNPAAVAAGSSEIFVPVIIPGWTLNFEMMFYLVFAIAILAPRRARLIALASIFTFVFVAAGALGNLLPPLSFYHNGIILEFFVGSAIGAACLEDRPISRRAALIIATVGFSALLGLEDANWLSVPRIVLFGVPATMIVVAVLRAEAGGHMRYFPLLDELGNASYSIYLTHVFVLAGLRVAATKLGIGGASPLFQAGFLLASLCVAAVTGLAVYRFVERPLTRLASRLLLSRKPQRLLSAA